VRVRRVALTGGIATGKSHVRDAFETLGVPTIDSDLLARQAVAPGTPGLSKVVERFGRQILDSSGAIDRRRLGQLVFADSDARRDLEGIIHPYVREATEKWFSTLNPHTQPFAIADIPLLYEVGRDRDFDSVIVVAASPDAQLRRVMERGLSESDARQRIGAQLPLAEKLRRADYVIHTDGSFDETAAQVRNILEKLRATG
jgi:dephospho-CoA kinase